MKCAYCKTTATVRELKDNYHIVKSGMKIILRFCSHECLKDYYWIMKLREMRETTKIQTTL